MAMPDYIWYALAVLLVIIVIGLTCTVLVIGALVLGGRSDKR